MVKYGRSMKNKNPQSNSSEEVSIAHKQIERSIEINKHASIEIMKQG
jgi:hypothetical protein